MGYYLLFSLATGLYCGAALCNGQVLLCARAFGAAAIDLFRVQQGVK
jgi:hypothetical protein